MQGCIEPRFVRPMRRAMLSRGEAINRLKARNRSDRMACLASDDLIALVAQAAYLPSLLAKCQRAMLTLSRGDRTGATAHRSEIARSTSNMTWRYRIVGALAFTLAAIQSPWVHAQWGYPGGYGNYGWGGWGGGGLSREALPGAWGPMPRAQAITTSRRPSPTRSTPTRSCGGTIRLRIADERQSHPRGASGPRSEHEHSGCGPRFNERLRDNPERADIY